MNRRALQTISFSGIELNKESYVSDMVRREKTGFMAPMKALVVFILNCFVPSLGKPPFPELCTNAMPENFVELFFKIIGVVKDCLQSFVSTLFEDNYAVLYSGSLSENPFRSDCKPSLMAGFFAVPGMPGDEPTGNRVSEWIPLGKDNSQSHPRVRRFSGKSPHWRVSNYRDVIPSGSQISSPFKQTGLYEKGDYYQ